LVAFVIYKINALVETCVSLFTLSTVFITEDDVNNKNT